MLLPALHFRRAIKNKQLLGNAQKRICCDNYQSIHSLAIMPPRRGHKAMMQSDVCLTSDDVCMLRTSGLAGLGLRRVAPSQYGRGFELSITRPLFVAGRGHIVRPRSDSIVVSKINIKSDRRRRKHCALAVVRRSQKFRPATDPLAAGAGRPKFIQLGPYAWHCLSSVLSSTSRDVNRIYDDVTCEFGMHDDVLALVGLLRHN